MEQDDDLEQSPLTILTGFNQAYTTKDAQDTAKKIFNEYWDSRTAYATSQKEADDAAEAAARSAQDVLKAARERILGMRYSNASRLLAISQGLGMPTKSGAFSESISNAAKLSRDEIANKEKFDIERDTSADKLGLDISDVDAKLAQYRAKTLELRRAQEQKLVSDALRIMAREVRPTGSGSQGKSPFGKIASDEGYIEGTPEYTARVTELYNADMHQRQQAAGVDVNEEDPVSQAALSNEFGIPYQVRDPFLNLSTKDKQRALEARKKEAADRLTEIGNATVSARKAVQEMNRFLQLNKDTPTGPWVGRFWPATIWGDAGQEMSSITAGQSRNLRVPGEGPMSNYDAKQLTMAAVSKTKRPEVNQNIANGVKAIKRQQVEYNRFMNDYAVVRGHLDGADQAWQEYVEANPVFDPKAGDGTFVLNKNRKDYKTYFREMNRARDSANDPTGRGLTPEQIAASQRVVTEGPDDVPEDQDEEQGFAEGGAVKKPKSKTPGLDKFMRSLAQGASFNFADEALAAASDDPYETAIANERRLLEEYGGESPGLNFLGEMSGGIPTSIALTALGTKGLGKVRKAGKVGKLASLVIPANKYGRMAIAGAGSGALSGAGSSQDEDPIDETLSGAAVGTVAGPLAGLVGSYGIKGAMRIWDFITGKSMSAADRKIVEAAIKDDTNLRDMVNQVVKDNKAGIPTQLPDTGGRNMRGLAESMAKRTGEGPDEMLDALEGRQMGAHERVSTQVNDALAPDEYFGQLEKLKEALYTQAKPLYEAAYAENPVVNTSILDVLHQTKVGQDAIERAIDAAKVTAATSGRPLTSILGKYDPVKGVITKPSLEFLDHIKRALDGKINQEEAAGATDIGHGLRALRRKLMGELEDPKKVTSTYKEAREQYAGDLEVLDALQLGRDNFLRLSPNEFNQLTSQMSYAEKDALRSGVAEALFTRVGNTAEGANPASKIIGTPGLVNKLRGLFDTEAGFNKFYGALQKEAQMFDRGKKVIGAGRAARVAAGDEAPHAARDLLISGGFATMAPGSDMLAQPGWMARLGNLTSRAFNPMRQETIDEVSRKLSTTDPAVIGQSADALQQELERLQAQFGAARRSLIPGALVGGSSVTPGPYGYTLDEEDETGSGGADEGFAEGGPVGMADPSGPRLDLSSLISGLPGSVGTGASRSRLNPTIDYEHYGQGPEAQHFANNTAPDPIFTPERVPSSYQTAPGASTGSKSSTLGGIGSLIGLATKVPKIVDAVKTVGGALGIGGGAGTLSSSTAAAAAAADPSLAAAMAPYMTAGGETAAAGGAGAAGATGGLSGIFGGASGIAPWLGGALAVAAPIGLAASVLNKDPADLQLKQSEDGTWGLDYSKDMRKGMEGAGVDPAAFQSALTPLLAQYYQTGDRNVFNSVAKPTGYSYNPKYGLWNGNKTPFGKGVDPLQGLLYFYSQNAGDRLDDDQYDILGALDKYRTAGGG